MSQTIIWFLVWGLIIFFMMRFGCGAHVMGHGGHTGHGHDHGQSAAGPAGEPPAQAVDPVCHMTVDTRDAKSAVHEGQVFYFCSSDCRDKFEAAPQSYAGPHPAPAGQLEAHHHG